MTPVEILRAARERIAVPERWTRLAEARGSNGRGTDSKDPEAVCWCGWGAVRSYVDSGDDASSIASSIVDRYLTGSIRGTRFGFVSWQDAHGRTHAEVLGAFDKAIALAEAES
jgi:hypothetical protein